jgi:uncharacterized protein with ParB-like and HNH nuclease domain
MNIITLLNEIKNDEIVLPAIQRDFVWKEEQLCQLLDSIMRRYPTGIILMWETYDDIQFRHFDKNYIYRNKLIYSENNHKKRIRIVLDGQQRLQSLYVALYGTYNDKSLYFDVLSGKESDDYKEEKYIFRLLIADEAFEFNNKIESSLTPQEGEPREKGERDLSFYIKVSDLFEMSANEKQALRKTLIKKYMLSDLDELRLESNLARLDEVLTKDENILKASVIDQNLPIKSQERKSLSDVLEIFVRINRLGTPLNRSDLLFSMLKLNWKESALALPEFINEVNKGNFFDIDIDFVIRCLFAVSDLGTKFDIDILRKKKHIDIIQKNFDGCCNAIKSTIDAIQNYCWVANSKLLGNYNTMVPFVYYLFRNPKWQLPNDQIDNFRKALFLFSFAKPFARYADSRLGKFIKEEIKPLADKGDLSFPFESAIRWVSWWEGVNDFDKDLVQRNYRIALHIIQGYTGIEPRLESNAPEIDHIFPRSILRAKGYDEHKVNNFANFWVLSKDKNQNKSNKHPSKYFSDVPDSIMKKALIDRTLLNYQKYNKFLKIRGQEIVNSVKRKIGFSSSEFEILNVGD